MTRASTPYYGRAGGCLITGNEDGIKHCSMGILYALQHLGYTIPPQADAGWIGEAGPGPSYGDVRNDGTRAGFDNDFTQRNTTFMTWNLMHTAHMIREAGGIPAHGNQRSEWEAQPRASIRRHQRALTCRTCRAMLPLLFSTRRHRAGSTAPPITC